MAKGDRDLKLTSNLIYALISYNNFHAQIVSPYEKERMPTNVFINKPIERPPSMRVRASRRSGSHL